MPDNHCIHTNEQINVGGGQQPFSSNDFVCLPIDFNNKCNVGYGFGNMTTPEAGQGFPPSTLGVEALREHFKNSKFPRGMDHYLPVVFSPPGDGRTLTEPSLVVALANQQLCEGSDPGADNSSYGKDQLGTGIGTGCRSSVSRQSSGGAEVTVK
ncbi:hypothetical protein MLD38_002351 [Melastoma candidum]|uniref:Uncharacterized protein n=1 Tax=Melastoma candidum TaxID=119954 RepID=A0ACB9RYQ9_9MYRT|nr:hypothetical protein MLD38_002351 [Melastoma candidum]